MIIDTHRLWQVGQCVRVVAIGDQLGPRFAENGTLESQGEHIKSCRSGWLCSVLHTASALALERCCEQGPLQQRHEAARSDSTALKTREIGTCARGSGHQVVGLIAVKQVARVPHLVRERVLCRARGDEDE